LIKLEKEAPGVVALLLQYWSPPVNTHKTNWNHMVFSTLWAYHTIIKSSTRFTPFQLVYGIESMLPIEFEIAMLHSAIKLLEDIKPLEQRLV